MTNTKKKLLSGVLALSMLASAGAAMGVTAYANTYEPVTAMAAEEKEDTAIWTKLNNYTENESNYNNYSLIMYEKDIVDRMYHNKYGWEYYYDWNECNIITNADSFDEQSYQVGEDVFGGYMGWFDLNDDDVDDLRAYYSIDDKQREITIDVVTTKDKIGFDQNVESKGNYMFRDFRGDKINGLENLDTSALTNMSGMFLYSDLEELDVSTFDTSNVTDMSFMFFGWNYLTSLDLSNFDTSNVTTMAAMFAYSSSLTELDLSSFNTQNVEDMQLMFYQCYALTKIDLSSFDTSNLTNMFCMFSGCYSLAELDLSNFDTSNVTDMTAAFQLCQSLKTLDLSNFDTSNVTGMQYMFAYCENLTELDVSSFDTSNVTTMSAMFYLCSSLKTLDLSSFDTSNVTVMSHMLGYCYDLRELTLGENFVFAAKENEEGELTYPETSYMFIYTAVDGYYYDEELGEEYFDKYCTLTIYNAPAETQKYIEDNQETLYYGNIEDGVSQLVFETTKEPVNVFKSVIKSLQFTFLMGLELIVYIYTVLRIWRK